MSIDRKTSDYLDAGRPLGVNQEDITRPLGVMSEPLAAFQSPAPAPTPAKSYEQEHNEILNGIGLGGLVGK